MYQLFWKWTPCLHGTHLFELKKLENERNDLIEQAKQLPL